MNWLTGLSGIGLGAAAILYVCGYLAHTVYYRLLGVDVGAQPFTYLMFSGDYLISIIISIPQLFSLIIEYSPKLIEGWRWLGIVSCLFSLVCILSCKKRQAVSSRRQLLVCVSIGLACLIIVLAEIKVLGAKNVLQPLLPVEAQADQLDEADGQGGALQQRVSIVRESYREHEKLGTGTPGFDEWKRWFDPLSPNTEQERNSVYLALLLLNIIFLITLSVVVRHRGGGRYSKVILVEASAGALLTLLLLPCVYATVGRVFSFPVVEIKLKVEGGKIRDKPSSDKPGEMEAVPSTRRGESETDELVTHPVFLIFQNESEIIVYDRLNLFQLKRVPRSQVVSVNQLGTSSPFEDCDLEQGFTPCEVLWAKNTEQIVDF